MAHGAPDFTKVMRGETDEVWIKGVAFRDPSVAACKPVSVENPALAYELATNRFKVKIEEWLAGPLSADVSDRAARLLGIIYGDQGRLLQRPTTKDLLVQLRNAGVEIDPRLVDIQDYDLMRKTALCDKYDFDYDAQGRLQYIKVYDGVTPKITLTFSYDAQGRLDTIVRS